MSEIPFNRHQELFGGSSPQKHDFNLTILQLEEGRIYECINITMLRYRFHDGFLEAASVDEDDWHVSDIVFNYKLQQFREVLMPEAKIEKTFYEVIYKSGRGLQRLWRSDVDDLGGNYFITGTTEQRTVPEGW